MVVGGGPGGMEAARVAALRGHEVHLYERQEKVGGAFNLAAIAPRKHELGKLTHYQAADGAHDGQTCISFEMVDAGVARALEARREKTELSADQIAEVSGAAAHSQQLSYKFNPEWFGVWPDLHLNDSLISRLRGGLLGRGF